MDTCYEDFHGKLNRVHTCDGAFEMEMETHVTHVSNWICGQIGWNGSSIKIGYTIDILLISRSDSRLDAFHFQTMLPASQTRWTCQCSPSMQ
jgi:hypothetical protein